MYTLFDDGIGTKQMNAICSSFFDSVQKNENEKKKSEDEGISLSFSFFLQLSVSQIGSFGTARFDCWAKIVQEEKKEHTHTIMIHALTKKNLEEKVWRW